MLFPPRSLRNRHRRPRMACHTRIRRSNTSKLEPRIPAMQHEIYQQMALVSTEGRVKDVPGPGVAWPFKIQRVCGVTKGGCIQRQRRARVISVTLKLQERMV